MIVFQKIKSHFILFSWMIIILFSCADSRPTVISGHPFTHHVKNNGYQPKQGDVIQYHFIQRNNSQGIINNTFDEGVPRIFRIPDVDPADDKMDRINPMVEAMMEMSEGDSLTLELLYELLPKGINDLEEGESMFFDIKLVEVKSKEEIEKEEELIKNKGLSISAKMQKLSDQYKSGKLNPSLKIDGVEYEIEEKGTGDEIKNGDVVYVHFSGHLLENGKKYLDSYSKVHPYQFRVGDRKVIAAWEKIIPTLNIGDKLYMFVPYQEAYGVAGSIGLGIPEKSDLAIYLEIVKKK